MKHFLTIKDLPKENIYDILERALLIKKQRAKMSILNGCCGVMIFEKPSTRTRISFEIAVKELGGYTLFMTPQDSQLGRGEPIKDTARVISRYAHLMIVRTFGQEKLEELARYSSIPVVNALSDLYHPCQVMSDLLTIFERTNDFSKLKIAWIGDGNNMAHSWINAAIYLPFELYVSTPKGYEPKKEILDDAILNGAKIKFTYNPIEAAKDADFINTDVWTSMGMEQDRENRLKAFLPYQINETLLSYAKKDVKVMHCLPAHRGEEITEDVIESQRSIVWDQAENRLHMQKAILEWIFS